MTKKFGVKYLCEHCQQQSTAECGFGRWMRNHPRLDSHSGIVQSDLDFIILRYKTSRWGRDYQLMMMVEVKEHGAEPDDCKRDILGFFNQLMVRKSKNMHGANTSQTIKVRSRVVKRDVSLRFFGSFLLQFENTNPDDSKWIKWNRKLISKDQLTEIIAMDRHPIQTDKMMDEFLRDRHRKDRNLLLPLQAA